MATMTIRLPDAKHARLRRLAERQGISFNKLVEEWASVALAQFDAETRFRARAARGNPKRGLQLLDRLEQRLARRDHTSAPNPRRRQNS